MNGSFASDDKKSDKNNKRKNAQPILQIRLKSLPHEKIKNKNIYIKKHSVIFSARKLVENLSRETNKQASTNIYFEMCNQNRREKY